jgi:hypothetical protein
VTVYVCIDLLKLKARQFRRVRRHNAGTGAIRSASTGAERVRVMAAWQSGCENDLIKKSDDK